MVDRVLSQTELDDAKRLKTLWQNKKDELNLSQVKAAKELGYHSQGAISQYLNGKVAMNFHAVAKFAKLLRVDVQAISPRFASLVTKPLPNSLTGYVAPASGQIGGVATDAVLTWFAMSEKFCEEIGVAPANTKLVRIEDGSFKELPTGSVVLVDDSEHKEPVDGVYLLQEGDKIIARRAIVTSDGVLLSSGNGKKQQISKEVFGLLRVLARVVLVITPVV
jgi:transcriptional regulator with XRE-family HTH domain